MTDTTVHRITGVAGGGKSTLILGNAEAGVRGLVDEFLNEGYTWEDFRWVSFSRSHADDLSDDVVARWRELQGDEFDEVGALETRVTTLHSLCTQLQHINYDDIICPGDDESDDVYREYWYSKGVPYKSSSSNPLKIVHADDDPNLSPAEKLIAVDQMLTLQGDGYSEGVSISVSAVQDLPVTVNDLHPERIISLVEEWRGWKDEQGYVEHHDYILEAANSNRTPRCQILMVDEAQDYAPLEYAVIKEWIESGDLDHVILCGDPHQSIYGFKLASPRYLTGRTADREEVLSESWRCSKEVCRLARTVLPESEITAAEDSRGRIYDESIPSSADFARLVLRLLDDHDSLDSSFDAHTPGEEVEKPQAVYILCRTNRQVGCVATALQREGIPFTGVGDKMGAGNGDYWPWYSDLLDIAEALRSVTRRTGGIDAELAETLIEYADRSEERAEMAESPDIGLRTETATGGSVTDIWTAFPDCSNARDILDVLDLSDIEREMAVGAISSNVELRPALVQIGTIHEAKGREAPATVIVDGYPHKLAQQYRSDDEYQREENRLAYTAITRALDTVVIARDFLGGVAFPPLEPSNIASYSPQTRVIEQ